MQFPFELFRGRSKVGRRQAGPGTAAHRFLVAEYPLAHVGGEAARRLPHAAGHQVDDRFGKCELAVGVEHVRGFEVVRQKEQRHVAD